MSIAGWRERARADGDPVRSFRLGLTFLAGIGLLTALWAGAAAARALRPPAVKQTQELASLLRSHEALARPSTNARSVAFVPARRPITEERTVLPVLGHHTGRSGVQWLHVRLPGRPNGSTGWIRRRATVATWTNWHVVVDTSSRRVTVYQHGRRARAFKAVVGKPSTPTPTGEFFVEESIKLSPGAVGAPFALALSARSNVFQEFEGGPGQIAFHGLWNVGGTPGTAVSHGCIRLDTGALRWLVARVGPGVPVTIKR